MHPIGNIPSLRLETVSPLPPKSDGQYVLYWMTAARRVQWNFALDRAIGWAIDLKRPLVVAEALTCQGRWDSDRHHRFVLEGMRDTSERLKDAPILYVPCVERRPGECQRWFQELGQLACVIVTDDHPTVTPPDASPAVKTSAAEQAGVRVEKVDSHGLLPLHAAHQAFPTAFAFRRFLQSVLRDHLLDMPRRDPLENLDLPRLKSLPSPISKGPAATALHQWLDSPSLLAKLPVNHQVSRAALVGGASEAEARWKTFLSSTLASYPELRNQPDEDAVSGLSPYLHYGHISAHQIFHDMARHEAWTPDKLADKATGARQGWWGMSEAAEAFLDQVVTWRELGFNFCVHRPDYAEYKSLPGWAKETLAKHASDARAHAYSLDEFASARTHDPLWNAAQRQLAVEGCLHNYLRMLWGKKILEWTASPQEALDVMIELNNRYALDGQDPNSYSGIFWILGRYDRPWGPERPIFGTIRYMSSENTFRKVKVRKYLETYSETGPTLWT